MVGTISHPYGATGKQPFVPDINLALSPIPPQLNTSGPPRQTSGNPDLMKMLVDMITMNNMRVKKLNLLRRQCQLDMTFSQPVLDDEDESPIPDISSFITPVISAQNPTLLVTPQADSPHPHPNPAPALNASSLNAITVRSHSPNPVTTPSDNLSPALPIDWQNVVAGNIDHAQATEPMTAKTMVIDHQNLGPIYSMNNLTKNKQQLDMTDVPNAILQMVYNKIYMPLSMLTTSALSKIHSNDKLKYHKIPFSNGIGKQ